MTLTANGTGANDLSGSSPVDSDGTLQTPTPGRSPRPARPATRPPPGSASAAPSAPARDKITRRPRRRRHLHDHQRRRSRRADLRKNVINDNGGTAARGLHADRQRHRTNDLVGHEPGDSDVTLDAGTYALSETGPAGYAARTGAASAAPRHGTLTIALGDTEPPARSPTTTSRRSSTCARSSPTTTAAPPSPDFTLTANGTGANDLSGSSPVDSGGTLQADTWTLSETGRPATRPPLGLRRRHPGPARDKITVGIGGGHLHDHQRRHRRQADSQQGAWCRRTTPAGSTSRLTDRPPEQARTSATGPPPEQCRSAPVRTRWARRPGPIRRLSNYTTTINGACRGQTEAVTLALGESKTCTITNTRKAAAKPPRTPGYWKNHQSQTTALLPITLGNYNGEHLRRRRPGCSTRSTAAVRSRTPQSAAWQDICSPSKLNLKNGADSCIQAVVTKADNFLKGQSVTYGDITAMGAHGHGSERRPTH